METPFEYLKRRATGEPFDSQTVRNWYIARAFVFDKFKDIAIAADSDKHLHVVVDGATERMLFVVRQIALMAHFLNYRDDDAQPLRTVISIVWHGDDSQELWRQLQREELLCNLANECRCVDVDGTVRNADSHVDIELRIVNENDNDNENDGAAILRQVSRAEVDAYFDGAADDDASIFKVDTRKAIYTSRIYDVGSDIFDLPAEDIHNAHRYTLALNVLQYIYLEKPLSDMVNDAIWRQKSPCRVKECVSNILCSDCFELRQRCIGSDDMKVWESCNAALSRSEHARWVVEKLILGYRPLNADEHRHDNLLQVQQGGRQLRQQYHAYLKRRNADPAHIDLCSYRDLRRINPDDLKLDSFLMLAIPLIMNKVAEGDKQQE